MPSCVIDLSVKVLFQESTNPSFLSAPVFRSTPQPPTIPQSETCRTGKTVDAPECFRGERNGFSAIPARSTIPHEDRLGLSAPGSIFVGRDLGMNGASTEASEDGYLVGEACSSGSSAMTFSVL